MIVIVGLCAAFLRILLKLTYPISDCVLDFIYRLIMGKTKPLPPIDNEIILMSATQLAEQIRKRRVSCEKVMRAYVERSRQIHPLINAVTDERYEDALKEAKDLDRFLDRRTKTEQQIARETPLLGVPFTCKESIGIKGLLQTAGMLKAKGHVADEDCHAAAFYRKAGAIPVAVTNVPEICMFWGTANLIYGMTKNPYDNRRTPGGSSGGEGAILASAGSVIGIGTDIGGSIRIPAAFCGIYGHKPSRGIVSNWGTYPYCHMTPDKKDSRKTLQFVSTGPMCRYAEDLPMLLKVLSDDNNRLRLKEKVNFQKVKVYYMEEINGMLTAATPDVKKAIKKAAKHFEDLCGTKPTLLQWDEMKWAFDIMICKLIEVGSPSIKTYLADEEGYVNLWLELVKCVFRLSNYTFPIIFSAIMTNRKKGKHYYLCLEKFKDLQNKFDEIFKKDAILLFPTHPEPGPHYLMTVPKFPNVGYTCIFNCLGFPVTAIPTGLSKGLPIGIQAISGQFKDHLTIATALELDKVFNGWNSPCPVSISKHV